MPSLYEADVPLWDATLHKQYIGKLYFILPHEVVHSMVAATCVEEWTGFDASQEPIKARLAEWRSRTNAVCSPTVCLGLWGDAAPYHTRDSVNLWLINSLSGQHRTRWWSTAYPKRIQCNCGCKGQRTTAAVLASRHNSDMCCVLLHCFASGEVANICVGL